jgi:NAD(P)-dependent dehydrogenase (short-subunit alcohol dehydrogenase family)
MTSPQSPIGSGFTAMSTTDDVMRGHDLRGHTAVVTGGYSGLGLETTRARAAAGAKVIVPARTPEKARAALAGIDGVELAVLDLVDPASISAFARTVVDSGRPVHLLVNSAGVMATPLRRDVEAGARQGRCRLSHAANGCISSAAVAIATTESRSGLSVTAPIGVQLRVSRDQRAGLRSRACT